MKTSIFLRLLFIGSFCLSVSAARAQYVAIPDSNFGHWLYGHGFMSCLTGSSSAGWRLDTTCSAVVSDTSMDCNYSNISDLTGIQYFSHLRSLYCYENHLISLPVLPNSLKLIQCFNNQLTSIPALPPALEELNCGNNILTSLPALPTTLTTLFCTNNKLTGFPTLPLTLLRFDCSFNKIYVLPALPTTLTLLFCGSDSLSTLPSLPPALGNLDCSVNKLTTLPSLPNTLTDLDYSHNRIAVLPTLPTSLSILHCSFDSIQSLPALPAGLTILDCQSNLLTSLPALPATLTQLICDYNYITALPVLPSGLNSLWCQHNQLTSLPLLPSSIKAIYCNTNRLTALPPLPLGLMSLAANFNQLSSLPDLPPVIMELELSYNPALSCLPRLYRSVYSIIYISHTAIQCLPSRISSSSSDVSLSAMPLCTPASGCEFYYNIAGSVHYDTAATCTLDSLRPAAPITGMKVQLRQGGSVIQQFYTFGSGGYSFKTPTLSTYTIDLDTTALPISVLCPQSGYRSVALSPVDSIERYQSFGMACAAADFGVTTISATRFRPTFTTAVSITGGDLALLRYNAPCSGGTGGTVTTTFSTGSHYISPAPGALTPSAVSGGTLTYTLADLDSLHAGSLDIILSTDSGAVADSSVCITTTVTSAVPDAHPANNTLTHCFPILHSWDPNHKEVYPTTLSADGGWLTYTIHFQNTGNDTAYLVVLRDTLSPSLDASSFQYLASSHHAVIQLFGPAIAFTFPKINLVDSATNPTLSEGWIQYRVRSDAHLPLGTEARNTAYIYFDQNPAIVTNTTVNTVLCLDTTVSLSHTICAGDTFLFFSRPLTTSGTYSDTLHTIVGCDSIISLSLTVNPSYTTVLSDTICSGQSYIFYGDTLRRVGTYSDTLHTRSGCDSVITLLLAVIPSPTVRFTWDSLSSEHYLAGRDSLAYWCQTFFPRAAIPLAGGSPSGGYYSGTFVHNDTLQFPSQFSQLDTIYYTYVNASGCSSTVRAFTGDGDCDGIHEAAVSDIHLYPNPNTGIFTLQTSNSIRSSYTIIDILGHVIREEAITTDIQPIDMREASAGIYTLTVRGAASYGQVKFVIVK